MAVLRIRLNYQNIHGMLFIYALKLFYKNKVWQLSAWIIMGSQVNNYITKSDSQMLKGFAILIMVFLHVFLKLDNDQKMWNLFFWQDKPLVWWLSQFASICVSLYMFLSGYGLYVSFKNGRGNFRFAINRVARLYKKVAFIACLFLPFSIFVPSLEWNLDFWGVIKTISGYDPYNNEWWFLLPWSIVCILSPKIFSLLERYGAKIAFAVGLLVFVAVRFFIYTTDDWIYTGGQRIFLQIAMVLNLGFIFILGACFAKEVVFYELIKSANKSRFQYVAFIIILIGIFVLRTFVIKNGIFDPIIAAAFCLFILLLGFKENVKKVFMRLGEKSTTMWLIHTFLVIYYLPDFFFGLRIPLLVYPWAVLVSYAVAVFIDRIYNYLFVKDDNEENIIFNR